MSKQAVKESPKETNGSSRDFFDPSHNAALAAVANVVSSIRTYISNEARGHDNAKKFVNPKLIKASADYHVRAQPSLLGSEAPPQDFRGLYNLAFLVLVALNLRLVVENFIKYGLLLEFRSSLNYEWRRSYPAMIAMMCMVVVSPLLAHGLEVIAVRKRLPLHITGYIHTLHVMLLFFTPLFVVHYSYATLEAGLICVIMTIIMAMKMWSYAHVCHDLRRDMLLHDRLLSPVSGSSAFSAASSSKKDKEKENHDGPARRRKGKISPPPSPSSTGHSTANSPKDQPTNQTSTESDKNENQTSPGDKQPLATPVQRYEPSLGHLYYFLAAPTLIYQLSYPRSPKVRKRFVLRRMFELVLCMALQVFLSEQYVLPLIKNSLEYFDQGNVFAIFERVLKLSIPNTCIWLLLFYAIFHAYLNLTAEVLRFGDRLFYRDWWNAQTLDVYWRNWNLPVHNWIVRHVYAPLLRHRFSSGQAQAVAFALSAVLHEVLVSVPCHTFKFWAFGGMMMQVPLIALSRWVVGRLKQPLWGNVLFWTSFLIFGQPLIILLYSHDYIRNHMSA